MIACLRCGQLNGSCAETGTFLYTKYLLNLLPCTSCQLTVEISLKDVKPNTQVHISISLKKQSYLAKFNGLIGKDATTLVQTNLGKRATCVLPAKHGKTWTHLIP